MPVKPAAASQNYPIQASVVVQPPYSLYLSDYASTGSEKLQVTLFLKDLSKSNYSCRLRLRIEGAGITVQSKNDFFVQPLQLNGGELYTFSGTELAPYLNPKNLIFQGVGSSGRIPEGMYRISVEVLDHARKSVVSNTASAILSVFLSYPPVANLPVNQSVVPGLYPQNLIFQWTPRHTASLNAAYSVAYRFRLAEVTGGRNPNDALRSSRPIFETFTDQTMLVYGPAEPELIPGSRYAFQVQAIEAEGKDVFINEGYSEVSAFTYGQKCTPPQAILAELSGAGSLKLSWAALPGQQVYMVRYRESGRASAAWFEQEAFSPSVALTGLRQGKTYEYQVKADCGAGYGEFSDPGKFTLPEVNLASGDLACGQAEQLAAADPKNRLTALPPGMVFMAGSFPVLVTEATGGNGTFSGSGTVGIPFLNQLNFDVVFQNIIINSELKLVNGRVSIGRKALEQSKEELLATLVIKPDENGHTQLSEALAASGLPPMIDVAISMPALPVYDAVNQTISFSGTIPGGKNKTITINTGGQLPLTFQDKNGETFEVDASGTVNYKGKIARSELLAGGSMSTAAIDHSLAVAVFKPAPAQQYGFDAYDLKLSSYSKYAEDYQPGGNGGQRRGWKALETGRTDAILVEVTGKTAAFDAAKVELRNSQGEKMDATRNGNLFSAHVMGATEGNHKEIYVYYPAVGDTKGANIGKLNLASYKKIRKKVVLVPVNGAGRGISQAGISQQLNAIFGQAVVEWEVKIEQNFEADAALWDKNNDNALEAGNSKLMSAYTGEQQALAGLYKAEKGMDANTYYIFLTERLSDGSSGYMVRSGQVGFVSPGPSATEEPTELARTIAHELGHGAFNLSHTWDEPGTPQGSTDNLMDYGGGTALRYRQWQYMRNPDLVMKVFEGDEEGALAGAVTAWEFMPFASSEGINLSKGAVAIFETGVIVKITDDGRYDITINGISNRYTALNDAITGQFRGFYLTEKLPAVEKIAGLKVYKRLDQQFYLSNKYYSVKYHYREEHSQKFWNLISKRKDINKKQADDIALLLESMSVEMYTDYLQQDQHNVQSKCKSLDIKDNTFDYSNCWDEITRGLRAFINSQKNKNESLLTAIKNTSYDEDGIKTKFRELSNSNYLSFTADERRILLSYLATRTVMSGDWWGKESEESFAIHIIETTPDDQIEQLFDYLSKQPLDPFNELAPVVKGKSLIYILDYKISDGILGTSIGSDNHIKAKTCLCNLVFKSNKASSVIATTKPDETPLVKDCYINLYQSFHYVEQIIFSLKEASQANKPVNISDLHLPNSLYDLQRVENVNFGGNHFDFIQLEIENHARQKTSITIADHLEKVARVTLYGKALYGIKVDGEFYLFVGSTQEQDNLYNYLNEKLILSNTNITLFVNGYRNNLALGLEKEPFERVMNNSNTVSRSEPYPYWTGIDKGFIERLKSNNVWYADGHASITTSNHLAWGGAAIDQMGFTGNMIHSVCASNSLYASAALHPEWYNNSDGKLVLHTVPNVEGFNQRRQFGRIAGNDIIRKIKEGTMAVKRNAEGEIVSKLDIIAHSMGYAYALGIIDALKASDIKISFGRFYIIAPENACSGEVNLEDFEEVWQYGSNLGQPDADPLWEQDGVAPQCAVQNIAKLPSSKGGRAYIPRDWKPKGFLESHSISNYGWIFNRDKGDAGYVAPR